ncbi:MAG: hypothetical protein NPINA01_03250 [Nitrospinaceae bacterium]|nr:MAG: hypothetical protein NPINA01_03250 [Nitrospinaceae bacterium]
MIDEIDYFPRRDKYKKKKAGEADEEWEALKKIKTDQDISKSQPRKKPGQEKPPEGKKARKPAK